MKLNHTRKTNNLRKSDIWKIQLTKAIDFISSKDTDEEQVMHSSKLSIKTFSSKSRILVGTNFAILCF